ncbi:NADPH-dependent ferric siderophore reductase, contains FAD-binding and SIP domains [Amycolatopsis arida]|uniref:NADPH-dependent ferric siderophore reductase, contains FAD-binding and SIP domains n=1 Tax=Amycolatopsis arida TaxID=587909 RepID=A0A1I5UXE0_9PSEU|nr:siderophore-interacting protein [Amycolatopsis arida]TDX91065.1 NADPH-dependent ferric siderophore reductase [Amycolatopsis arida]SFP99717.1 NADPH-dependent ferric siderophore reductase, contains FAD-binding and SIP domains [Amycolatopsis arida]
MAEQPARKRPLTRLRVQRVERITPHMIRVVAGGDGLAEFVANGFTDSYVKLVLPVPGVRYPEPFDMRRIRAELPPEQWPTLRTYTVRYLDRAAGELAIDFVHHGDQGLGGPWAAAVRPGDEMMILGPGGAYAPSADVDWHLLVGDESALPAIGAALEAMPAGAPVRALILVEDGAEEQLLVTKGDAEVRWLHRRAGDDVVAAVRALDFPAGTVQAFVHGEAGFVRELRRHLLDERGVRRDLLSISGYWRRGKNDEEWRAEKAAEKASEKAS